MELYHPRANTKSGACTYDLWIVFLTHGKKKKSFLKWLKAYGFHRNIIESFEKWVINGKGKYSYDILTFKYYLSTEYFYKEESK